MTQPCRTCGCDPYDPDGHHSSPSGLCHAKKGNLECKCSHYVASTVEAEGREVTE